MGGTLMGDSAKLGYPDFVSFKTGKYFQDNTFHGLYNRILPSKVKFNFGVVTGSKTEQFSLWNGYSEAISLSKVNLIDMSGVSVQPLGGGGFPVSIPPHKSVFLELMMSDSGSASVNGRIEFVFSNGYSFSLDLKGSRMLVLDAPPNWDDGLFDRYTYRTDILVSRNRKEQRRSLMPTPRRTMSFKGMLVADRMRVFANMLHGWHNKPVLVPVWTQMARITEPLTAGMREALIPDLAKFDFVVGGKAVIWQDAVNYEAVEIVSVRGQRLVFGSDLQNAFPAGTTIYPATPAHINEEVLFERRSAEVVEIELSVDFSQKDMVFKMPTFTPDAEHWGIEVLERKPNWAEDFNETHVAQREIVDYAYGVQEWYELNSPSLMSREVTFLARGFDEIQWWRSFIHRRKGAWKSFLMPSQSNDLHLLQDLKLGTNEMFVRDDLLNDVVKSSSERRYLRLQTAKSVYYFTIIEMYEKNGQSALRLRETFPEDIARQDVLRISFMQRMRFAGDEVEINHLSKDVAEITAIFQQIREV